MRRKTAVVLGVSGAALALTASSAFTATGLTTTGVDASKVIGGSFTQSLTGVTLSNIEYTWNDDAKTELKQVKLTFGADAGTLTPTVTLTGGTASNNAGAWSCTAVNSSHVSTCSYASGGYATGVTAVVVTAGS